jgi:hypothetical protein
MKCNILPIERWIRLIVGSQAIVYSVLSYTHSPYWTFPLIIMGWTLLLSFFTNCSPLMMLFWALGAPDERPEEAKRPWVFGRGAVFYIERWTRLLAGMAYFGGGSMAFFHLDYFQAPQSYWSIVTASIAFVQFQGAFTNWCPSLGFMKWIGVKDEQGLRAQTNPRLMNQ